MLAQKSAVPGNLRAIELVDLTTGEDTMIKVESNTKRSPVNEQLTPIIVQPNGLPYTTPSSLATESAQLNGLPSTTAGSTAGSATADSSIADVALSPPAEDKAKSKKRSQRAPDVEYETRQPKRQKGCVVRGRKSSQKYSPVVEKDPMIVSNPEGPGLVQLRCRECGSNQGATNRKTFYAGGPGYAGHYNMCHQHVFRAGTGLAEIVRCNTEKELSQEDTEQAYAGTYYVKPKASVGRLDHRVARAAQQMGAIQQEPPEADRDSSIARDGLGLPETNGSAGAVEAVDGGIKTELQQ